MIVDNIRQQGEPARAATQCQTSRPRRILVVDDEPLLRELNVERLLAAGYHVDAAADGAAAWDTLQLHGYDLIITDNAMPKMTGVQMIGKVRAAGMVVPVILASGTLVMEEFAQCPWLQPAATLPKPYTGGELLGMVKKVLAQTSL